VEEHLTVCGPTAKQ